MSESHGKSRPVSIFIIIVLLIILAFLGFASGSQFIIDPSGVTHGMDTSILENTPVGDFLLIGIFFVIFFGILPILTVFGLWKLPRWRWTDTINKWTGQNWAWTATVAVGSVLVLWIVIEVILIGSPDGFPRFLQIIMGLLGIIFLILAMLPRVRSYSRIIP